MSDNEYAMTQKEAADFLDVSIKSITRYRKRGLPFKMILNPATGKQEVRFRRPDLEKWSDGRRLMATYARDAEPTAPPPPAPVASPAAADDSYLDELLQSYKNQIGLLRDQLEDMREQLARRDRQIDDLMRMMVGLQLEYKPMPLAPDEQPQDDRLSADRPSDLYEAIVLPADFTSLHTATPASPPPDRQEAWHPKKTFSREQLAASVQRLRQKGKSYEEIARALDQIQAAPPSGRLEWSASEVQSLLPPLVDNTLAMD
ncbi:MAG: helix-turn-helix domain-containing protein [Desulfobulbus oligotrophicus]|jgi:DNA-binding transcriptional MerR regulator|nr:helix-turn-helix domain-containing protein [Desulfobulbus oligotrophicus]